MKREIAILGAGGLTGRELLRLLQHHPNFQVVFAASDRYAGQLVGDIFTQLAANRKLRFQSQSKEPPSGLPVLLATPNEVSMKRVPSLIERGHTVIDLSGAFRLPDRHNWERAYGQKHTAFELLSEAVFGLPELFRQQIKDARLISNPGCYPTAAIIPLYALGQHRQELGSITIDAYSGVSGAGGRTEESGFFFQQIHENFRAYKVLSHQHEAEIAQYAASGLTGAPNSSLRENLVFTPHLLPIYRGLLATITLRWKEKAAADLQELLANFANCEPFVKFCQSPEEVQLSQVQGSNFLVFGLRSRGAVTVITTALDNLVKGAAGQALQNLNLLYGLPETEGLL